MGLWWLYTTWKEVSHNSVLGRSRSRNCFSSGECKNWAEQWKCEKCQVRSSQTWIWKSGKSLCVWVFHRGGRLIGKHQKESGHRLSTNPDGGKLRHRERWYPLGRQEPHQGNLNRERKKESEVVQLCPTLWDPMDRSLPGSSVHGIFQARVLEWVAISFSRGSSQPGIEPRSPALQADTLPSEPPGKSNIK